MSWALCLPVPVDVCNIIVQMVERMRAADAYAEMLDEFRDRGHGFGSSPSSVTTFSTTTTISETTTSAALPCERTSRQAPRGVVWSFTPALTATTDGPTPLASQASLALHWPNPDETFPDRPAASGTRGMCFNSSPVHMRREGRSAARRRPDLSPTLTL
jgi:hypothetical protein